MISESCESHIQSNNSQSVVLCRNNNCSMVPKDAQRGAVYCLKRQLSVVSPAMLVAQVSSGLRFASGNAP
jgi:hypothetical protein